MTRPEDSQRIGNLAFYAVVLLIAYLGYQIVQPFLIEIGWAAVLAICLAPVQARVSRRIGWPATRSTESMTSSTDRPLP